MLSYVITMLNIICTKNGFGENRNRKSKMFNKLTVFQDNLMVNVDNVWQHISNQIETH